MMEFTYKINDEHGMHARPAGKLVQVAKQFSSEITISTASQTSSSAKQILGLMKLGVKCNDEITITVSGDDEEAAFAAVKEFITQNF